MVRDVVESEEISIDEEILELQRVCYGEDGSGKPHVYVVEIMSGEELIGRSGYFPYEKGLRIYRRVLSESKSTMGLSAGSIDELNFMLL